jgi:O-antigen/teichoic acid export membrane protein
MSFSIFKKNKRNILSLVLLGGFTLLGAVLTFLFYIFLARNSSPTVLGNYSSVFYLLAILTPLCGFGVVQYLLKIYGRLGDKAVNYNKTALKTTLLTTLVTIFLSFILVNMFFSNDELWLANNLMIIVLLGGIGLELKSMVLQLEGNYFLLALWQIVPSFLRIIGVLILIVFFEGGIDELSISLVVAIAGAGVFLLSLGALLNFYRGKVLLNELLKNKVNDPAVLNVSVKDVLSGSAPFGLAVFLYLLYTQSSLIIVRVMSTAEVAGYFSVAMTIVSAAMLFPTVVYQKFLTPLFHKWAYHDLDKLYKAYKIGNYFMFLIGCVISIFIWYIAPILILNVFGEIYAPSIPITQYLSLSIPLIYLASNSGAVLLTERNIEVKVLCIAFSAFVSITLSVLLVTHYSASGAVIGIISASFILSALYMTFVHKFFNRSMKN